MEADGYDLGAQRRPVDPNDLPQVQAELGAYLDLLRAGESESVDEFAPDKGLIVGKGKVSADGDYNLSGERYRVLVLGTTATLFRWWRSATQHYFALKVEALRSLTWKNTGNGGVAWATLVDLPADNLITEIRATQRTISSNGLKRSSAALLPKNSVVVSTRATIGRIGINRIPLATNQGFKNIVIEDPGRALPEFVALAITNLVPTMDAWANGGTFKEISKSLFCQLQIPLPPLEVQQEIVAEIEGYQRVIDGARAVVENYRPRIAV